MTNYDTAIALFRRLEETWSELIDHANRELSKVYDVRQQIEAERIRVLGSSDPCSSHLCRTLEASIAEVNGRR